MDNNKMTIYSNIITGQIVMVVGGIQDMSVFGDAEERYSEKYSCLICDYNFDVINGPDKYLIKDNNLINKESETNDI